MVTNVETSSKIKKKKKKKLLSLFNRYCITYCFARKGGLWEYFSKLVTKTANAWMSAWWNVTSGKADQLFTSSSDEPSFPLIYLYRNVLLQIKLSNSEKESTISVKSKFVCFVFTELERKLRANDREYNLSFKYAVSMKTCFSIHLVQ